MNIIEILFTCEWVATLFIVILICIASKIFVIPRSSQNIQAIRVVLMKRREERENVEPDV